METNTQNKVNAQRNQGKFVEPTVFVKGDYITLALPGNILVRKHVNYFKKIMGVSFIPKVRSEDQSFSNSPSLA